MTEQYKLELEASLIDKGDKAIPIKHGNKYGFFFIHTCKFIKPKYNWVWNFIEGVAEVWLNGKRGYVDYNGNETWTKIKI